MFKRLLSKKGEGVLTGILWMATVAIVTGGIALAIWKGITVTADSSKVSSSTAGNTLTNSADAIPHP